MLFHVSTWKFIISKSSDSKIRNQTARYVSARAYADVYHPKKKVISQNSRNITSKRDYRTSALIDCSRLIIFQLTIKHQSQNCLESSSLFSLPTLSFNVFFIFFDVGFAKTQHWIVIGSLRWRQYRGDDGNIYNFLDKEKNWCNKSQTYFKLNFNLFILPFELSKAVFFLMLNFIHKLLSI